MSSLVWLITGCSSGLGLSLAKAVLNAGHKVIATSRNPDKTRAAVAEISRSANGAWMQLDVADPDLEQRVQACVEKFGRIDVLVNNAGYALGGPLEDSSMDEVRRQMETNFFGPVRVMKSLIPHMREQKSGTIVNVTSAEGIMAVPGISMYGSSKFALEAVSEALQGELAAFGIRVLIVEPGGMRTNFLDQANVVEAPMSEPYQGGIVEHVISGVFATAGQQMLDPERSARRIVEAVAGSGEGWPEGREKYLRLPLGKEVVGRVRGKVESLQTNVDAMENIWKSVDFDTET